MGSLSKVGGFDNLGNHIYLEKQDKLRDIGVDIQTSQIVVVGGQSSGKSSLLENLTGFSFPRGQGLCTRYATQITLRRNPVESIVISITPSNDATAKAKQDLRAFNRELKDFEPTQLAGVMDDASKVMGIRSGDSKDDLSLPMFSNHILKVEISGPEKPHLTVIDVPGLFQVTDEGTTTDHDKAMVEYMVRRYMENERTIVLAVMSCLADRATEGIMQFAKSADPNGERTVGVLTKADLVKEKAVHKTILDLVKGNTLKLGYFVVRSRGADEDGLDVSQCRKLESQLFEHPSWEEIAKRGRTGVQALKTELQGLLTDMSQRELPKQRAEVEGRLEASITKLDNMGPARSDAASQRECLVKLTLRFERIVRDALEGLYEGDKVFVKEPKLKLITKIIDLNEGFSDYMAEKGHNWGFVGDSAPSGIGKAYENLLGEIFMAASGSTELNSIALKKLSLDNPAEGVILSRIQTRYRETRGPEIGTFGGSLLTRIFQTQALRWTTITNCHVKSVIVVIHNFFKTLVNHVFTDVRMRNEIWQTVLPKLKIAYNRAIENTKSLIDMEREIRPSTYNHYFNDNLQKARLDRLSKGIKAIATATKETKPDVVSLNMTLLNRLVENKSNAEHVQEDLHDILKSYYKVARKRFVDNICRQVIDQLLLYGPESPTKILTPEIVMTMSDSQLDRIAGEDTVTRRERERLKTEVQGLKEAMEVLLS